MAEFRTVAAVDDLGENEGIVVEYGRMWVVIFKRDGEYLAIEDRCSHADVNLSDGEVDLAGCWIKCPKHGSRFDLKTGRAMDPPAIMPVRRFEVQIQDGQIQIAPEGM